MRPSFHRHSGAGRTPAFPSSLRRRPESRGRGLDSSSQPELRNGRIAFHFSTKGMKTRDPSHRRSGAGRSPGVGDRIPDHGQEAKKTEWGHCTLFSYQRDDNRRPVSSSLRRRPESSDQLREPVQERDPGIREAPPPWIPDQVRNDDRSPFAQALPNRHHLIHGNGNE